MSKRVVSSETEPKWAFKHLRAKGVMLYILQRNHL